MRPSESPDAPIYVRNEDATKAANLCARQLVDFLDELANATSAEKHREVIMQARKEHNIAFDAFIYGVEYGRNNPRIADASAESAEGETK